MILPRFGGVFFQALSLFTERERFEKVNTMNEIWKPVVGHAGYEVSDHGRVRSYFLRGSKSRRTLRRPRLLSAAKDSFGYRAVVLSRKFIRIHALVAQSFIGPRPAGADVMHLDGSTDNNSLSNLRYGSRSENQSRVALEGGRLLSVEQVRFIRSKTDWKPGDGRALARRFSVTEHTISDVKRGKSYRGV